VLTNILALLGRLLLSAIFIQSGLNKALSPGSTVAMMSHYGLPLPPIAYLVSVLVELLGGIAVLVGFRARWAGALLAIWCVATALVAHDQTSDPAQMIQFMKNLSMAGGFLMLAAFGPGRLSIDRR
jgi:putative oxidoreductase